MSSEAIDPKFRRRVTGLAIAAAVGGFLFGFDSSVVNGAVDAIGKQIVEPAVSGGAFAFVKGFVVAVALLASALGAWIAGGLADRWGRPRVMLIGAILFFLSAIGAGLSQTIWDLMLWRVVGGIGIGIASVIAPAYIGEVAPKGVRGGLASLQQLAITIGILVALVSDAAWNAAARNNPINAVWLNLGGWRWMFIVGVIPAIVYGILAMRIPESPRYLLLVGRRDEAERVFSTIMPKEEIDGAIGDIERGIAEDKKNAKASLRGPVLGLNGIVWIGIVLSAFQQFVGINVVFYYSNSLWTAVGLGAQASLLSVLSGAVNVAVTFIAIALVDKIGRRVLLLVGSVGMAVTLGMEAVAFSFATLHNGQLSLPTSWAVVSVISANVFIIAFGATWGPLVWVLLGEIFPSRIRARALGVAAAAQWIANFIISETFPPLSAWSLPWTYTIYAIFAAASFFFVFWIVPETKGVALERTEELFLREHRPGRRGARRSVDANRA